MSLSSSYPRLVPPPRSGWPARSTFHVFEDVGEAEHLVQLYETEPYLVACGSRFLGDSMRSGGGALVITTAEHGEALEAALDLQEICVAAGARRGQYVGMDAERTLEAVTGDGQAAAAAFRHRVGQRLAELTRRWHRVRVLDELGALLWQEGRHGEATLLEREWIIARRRHGFARLSTFPACGLSDECARAAFDRLCRGAVRVLPPQRSIGADVLRALRASRAAPPPSTHRRPSRERTSAARKAAAR